MTAPALQTLPVKLPKDDEPATNGVLSGSKGKAKTNGIHDSDADSIVKERPGFSGRGRPLRVVCIGAGASGIYAAIKLPRTYPQNEVELQIYEKNPDVGGCWFENRYPGCACDIPSHVYAYSFAPNPDWSNFYSSSSEIQAYFKGVCERYHGMQYIKLSHKVVGAFWDERGQWDLRIQGPDGKVFDDQADILINASGILNSWKWPDIKGLDTFAGPRLHSANWDAGVEFNENITVGVIGNGSSAIQIVPRLQPKVKKLDTFIRTKTWVALPFTSGKIKAKAAEEGKDGMAVLVSAETSNPPYSDEERKRFREDPEYFHRYRKEIEHENNARFAISTRMDSDAATAAIPMLTDIMKTRLARKPELAELLIPEWHVGCRRLTPGVGYLEALCEDNVEVVRDAISHIEKEGIVTKDGKLHKLDVLICATGFDASNRPRFETSGRDGYQFTDEWAASPKGYMTVAMAKMPNYFVVNGPNAPIANGSLIPAMEKALDYIVQIIGKVAREDVKSICIKDQAVEDFCNYSDAWMPRSIWASGCRSWYKGGKTDGRVILWPGSVLHFMEVLKTPRFEDYDFTYLQSNPFAYFGNGLTFSDVDPKADKAPYLDNAHIPI